MLPIDITKCPLEAFSFINKFVGSNRISVILLYVVNLNIVALENRIIEDLFRAAEKYLKALSDEFINARLAVHLRVRVGKPAREILAEARESKVDLIVLTSHGGWTFWNRLFQPRIIEKVVRAAPCNATLLRVHSRLEFSMPGDEKERMIFPQPKHMCLNV